MIMTNVLVDSPHPSTMMTIEPEEHYDEGHRMHLKALVRQERNRAYRRHDYLSHEWQSMAQSFNNDLHSNQRQTQQQQASNKLLLHQQQEQRHSPSSVGNMMMTTIDNDDYLHDDDDEDSPTSSSSSSSSDMMCIRWREKIIEWKYQVIDRFDLSREIVSISTFYLDQYLAMHSVDDELFQLVAMSSIYLAIKIHSPKKVTMRSIASTGNGLITVKHIEAMELSIIETLNWHLFPPTCVSFIENFYPLLVSSTNTTSSSTSSSDDNNMYHPSSSYHNDVRLVDALEFSRFLAELSVCAYPFVSVKPSSIAIAAILYSMEYFGLPEDLRCAFQMYAADASLDVNSTEVGACGKLLRRVYTLAMPSSSSSSPENHHPFRAC